MARYCSVCLHPDAESIDRELRAGVPVRSVASGLRFSETAAPSEAALRRHQHNHLLGRSLLNEQRLSQDLSNIDLMAHLEEALGDLAAVRSNALATGHPGLLLRSADTTSRLVAQLLALLGDGDLDNLSLLKRAQALAQAVGAVIRERPEVGGLLANELDRRGAPDVAAETRALAVQSAIAASAATSTTTATPGATS